MRQLMDALMRVGGGNGVGRGMRLVSLAPDGADVGSSGWKPRAAKSKTHNRPGWGRLIGTR